MLAARCVSDVSPTATNATIRTHEQTSCASTTSRRLPPRHCLEHASVFRNIIVLRTCVGFNFSLLNVALCLLCFMKCNSCHGCGRQTSYSEARTASTTTATWVVFWKSRPCGIHVSAMASAIHIRRAEFICEQNSADARVCVYISVFALPSN